MKRNRQSVVTIDLSDQQPIRRTPPLHLVLLLIGLLLALHPLAWMILLQYRDQRQSFDESESSNNPLVWLLDGLSHVILDVTPKLSSGGLTFFLAGFFFFLGSTKISSKT
jgi:hypothetical protein